MRPLVLITLVATLLGASQAEARLFLQTYGSVMPADECGSGCTWNWNQDYFVPRHCDSCRYGLFSPCKTSCTNSPACHYCHALMPGYCSNYGPWHYCRRNHVYGCKCGCCPVETYCGPYRHGCGPGVGCHKRACCAGGLAVLPGMVEYGEPLANVEPPRFEILGSIPVQGDELLASLNMAASAGSEELPGVLLPEATPVVKPLPSLGLPPTENPPQVPAFP